MKVVNPQRTAIININNIDLQFFRSKITNELAKTAIANVRFRFFLFYERTDSIEESLFLDGLMLSVFNRRQQHLLRSCSATAQRPYP